MPSRIATLLLGACLGLSACVPSREAGGGRTSGPQAPRGEVGRTSEAVQGFRVQVHLTPEKTSADAYVEAVHGWWRGLPAGTRADVRPGGDLPVEVAWRQPYYRVRAGAFASQAEAQAALAVFRDRFPEAILVPAVVTVVSESGRGEEGKRGGEEGKKRRGGGDGRRLGGSKTGVGGRRAEIQGRKT